MVLRARPLWSASGYDALAADAAGMTEFQSGLR